MNVYKIPLSFISFSYLIFEILSYFPSHISNNPQVKWYKDTMLLDQNNHRRMSSYGSRHLLILSNVRETDFGNYSCVADNSLGKERAYVDVSGKKDMSQELHLIALE